MANHDLQTLLVRHALVTPDQLTWAIGAARGGDRTWLEQLLLRGLVDEELLCRWVSHDLCVPWCNHAQLTALSYDVMQLLPTEVAVEHRALPLWVEPDGDLHVAMTDPCDPVAIEEVHFFAGRRLVREVAIASAIAWGLYHYYGVCTALWPRTCSNASGGAPWSVAAAEASTQSSSVSTLSPVDGSQPLVLAKRIA
jgi:hypothetical protein